ncbi:11732_t:CDS:1 [Paraglomus brasilianum]|uniref:11732_t:CDS:1 n=1 Tax=Paraglomus brasilianum TaxID=144538 RepID=A0A9N9E389_9GLOM|nr:11732_t:CDS:1 [Paraglomus brasilianum]
MAYFTQTEVSKWCCNEVFQFYQKNYPYYDLKQILDAIKKDLKKFIDSSPNQEQKEQAQWIIDNYKVVLILLRIGRDKAVRLKRAKRQDMAKLEHSSSPSDELFVRANLSCLWRKAGTLFVAQ